MTIPDVLFLSILLSMIKGSEEITSIPGEFNLISFLTILDLLAIPVRTPGPFVLSIVFYKKYFINILY